MTFWEAVILGIVQGLTEFLPVSSSGHLLLLQNIFGIEENQVFITIILHLGTFFAVVAVFFKDIIALFKPPYKNMLYLILATIPAVVVMLVIKDHVDMFFTQTFLCFGFLITAILLFVTQSMQKKHDESAALPVNSKSALIMGGAQAVAAIVPGISRSGSTISAGLLSGVKRSQVARFSFLMSLPAIAGSALGTLIMDGGAVTQIGAEIILTGFITSFLAGILAIKFMLRLIQKCNYKWFSLYLLLLFVLVFVNQFVYQMW